MKLDQQEQGLTKKQNRSSREKEKRDPLYRLKEAHKRINSFLLQQSNRRNQEGSDEKHSSINREWNGLKKTK